jgi:tetratricopeptide (TPR) repeat protein
MPEPAATFPRAEQALLLVVRGHPQDADAALRLALLYHDHGRPADAVPHYQAALRLRPHDADALCQLGSALSQLGRSDDALDCYRRAVEARPNHAEALTGLGVALAQRGQLIEGAALMRRAVEADSGFAKGHHNLGVAQAQQGQNEDAVASFRHALQLQPAYPEAHFNLGNTLGVLGRRDESVAAYREAVRQRPDYAEALCNLGLALTEAGQPGEASVLLRQATRLRPQYAEAHNNLGLALADLGRFEEAIGCYERALAINPRYAAAHSNLGSAAKGLCRPEEAVACYETALRYEPDSASSHWNLSLALLQAGAFGRGWEEYEWRWKRPGTPPRPYPRPWWDGGPLAGRTVLLWCEQGLGDAIQFARYAALVKARGGRVVLECPGPLLRLFPTLPGIDALVAEGASLPPYDCHAPLMSLPRLLGTTLAGVPAEVPYLTADASLVEAWGRRLKPLKGFKVGIAWQGNPHHKWDRWRSVPLTLFAALAEVPRVRLVSVQHGPGSEQPAALRGRFPVTQLGKEFGSGGALADTAAVMASLDLVVSVDTATAHLAGALGVPVWVPLPTLVDWRWLLGRDDSPWYPTMRLFRQKALGDWEPVFERMAAELRKRAAGRPDSPGRFSSAGRKVQ